MAKLNDLSTSLLNRSVRLRLTVMELSQDQAGTILAMRKAGAENKQPKEQIEEEVERAWPTRSATIVSAYVVDGLPRYTVVTGDGKLHDVGPSMVRLEVL